MLSLTHDAAHAIEDILQSADAPTSAGVRITQAPSGTNSAGPSELRVTLAEEPVDGDEVIEEEGARVFVEDTVSGYLDDKELDAQVVGDAVRFSLA